MHAHVNKPKSEKIRIYKNTRKNPGADDSPRAGTVRDGGTEGLSGLPAVGFIDLTAAGCFAGTTFFFTGGVGGIMINSQAAKALKRISKGISTIIF